MLRQLRGKTISTREKVPRCNTAVINPLRTNEQNDPSLYPEQLDNVIKLVFKNELQKELTAK